MLFDSEQVAVVTGSSRGIGRAIALELAKEGATVVVHYGRKEDEAQATLKEIEDLGGHGMIIKADVSQEKEVASMFRTIRKEFGRVDVVVNNAGIIKDGYLTMMSSQKWDDVININLRGCFLCSREAVKAMVSAKHGAIVNIASTSGIAGQEGQLNYSASKGGIITFTKGLAREVARYNIRANAVAPGFIQTDMVKQMEPEILNKFIELIPMKRMGKPEEVGRLVSFLASENASYITGKVFTIDGGLIAQ